MHPKFMVAPVSFRTTHRTQRVRPVTLDMVRRVAEALDYASEVTGAFRSDGPKPAAAPKS